MLDQLIPVLTFLAGVATTLGVEYLRARSDRGRLEVQLREAREARRRDFEIERVTELQRATSRAVQAGRDLVGLMGSELYELARPPEERMPNYLRPTDEHYDAWSHALDDLYRIGSAVHSEEVRATWRTFCRAMESALYVETTEDDGPTLREINSTGRELQDTCGDALRALLST